MANNPYLSRLLKIAEAAGKREEFTRVISELPQVDGKPQKEHLQKAFAEMGLTLPQMGTKKLTAEEKQKIQEEKENKLLQIYRNGLQSEKLKLDKIIVEHDKVIEQEKAANELKQAISKLKKLGIEENDLKKIIGLKE